MSRPSMSAYVLSFLDSMRQRTYFLGHKRTLTDSEGHWRTRTDIGGLGRTLADSDGHCRIRMDNGGLRRTLADSDGLVLPGEACLPKSHNKEEPLSSKSCAKNSHNVCPPMSAYVLSFLNSMRQRTCFLGH